jgi:hypothetical protein
MIYKTRSNALRRVFADVILSDAELGDLRLIWRDGWAAGRPGMTERCPRSQPSAHATMKFAMQRTGRPEQEARIGHCDTANHHNARVSWAIGAGVLHLSM